MSKDTVEIIIYSALLGLLIVGSVAFNIFGSYQEANTFNRICQPKVQVTTWDAMWSELRVDSCVNK